MLTRDLMNHNRGDIENWARARAKTAYVGDAVLCRVLNSHNMYVDPKNVDMSPYLMLDGFWEMWITMAIGRAIQPGWTCIDGGAWCGYYTLLMADLVGPKGNVLSFEPNSTHYELMLKSAMANGYTNVRGYPLAISNADGEQSLWTSEYGGGSHLSGHGTQAVETRCLDNINVPVNFIKLDIEGGEEKAWFGMLNLLARNPQCIVVMEWEPARYKDVEGFITSICRFAQPREITTDGLTAPISRDDLKKDVMRMVWLQA